MAVGMLGVGHGAAAVSRWRHPLGRGATAEVAGPELQPTAWARMVSWFCFFQILMKTYDFLIPVLGRQNGLIL